ncbi:hypothetical protein ACQJBY_040476 [Aegilops geniculata]
MRACVRAAAAAAASFRAPSRRAAASRPCRARTAAAVRTPKAGIILVNRSTSVFSSHGEQLYEIRAEKSSILHSVRAFFKTFQGGEKLKLHSVRAFFNSLFKKYVYGML